MKLEDIPEMPGYISVARAARIFDMTKASIYYKIYEQEKFKHVYRLGGGDEESRPVLLLLESEVRQVAAREAEEAAVVPLKDRLNAWNKRVKDWGRRTGWSATEIHVAGQPDLKLQAAYLAATPQDVRPE